MKGKVSLASLLALLVLGFAASTANAAEFGIVPGSLAIETIDGVGDPDGRAGAHPDRLQISYALNTEGTGTSARDFTFELSPGLGGDATAVPTCPRAVFDGGLFTGEELHCPPESQVGIAEFNLPILNGIGEFPIYNFEPAPGEGVALGVSAAIIKIPLLSRLRPDDYGLTLELSDLIQPFAVISANVELWGVPADHQEGTSIPRRPFLTTPTQCGSPLAVTLRVRSWQPSAPWLSATANTGTPLTDCQQLPFDPRIGFGLTNPVVDAPTGASIDLTVPQSSDPDGRASSHAKRVSVALPEGVSLSPGGADGHSVCSDIQLGLGTTIEAACPPTSKVGTVELEGQQLPDPLMGAIFLGEEKPGERFRLFVVASGMGIDAKLAGTLRPDPDTGRLTVTLDGLPQVSLSRIGLRLEGGPRGLLAAPLNCGPAVVNATIEPYSGGPPVTSSDTVSIGGNPAGSDCPSSAPFSPSLIAGTSTLRAGRPTSFSLTLRRRDGEQLADRFSVTLPPGLAANLGSVETCPASAVDTGGCPVSSRIGSAVAELGSGPEPVPVEGDMYLTGRYRGAPFGFALVLDAALGPFDLGAFTVRGVLRFDSQTGQVEVATDPLPRIIEGIPVRFQTIGLDIDQPGFLRNPTSCAPKSVAATIRSQDNATAHSASPFTVKGCDKLRFRPLFLTELIDNPSLRRGSRPGLRIEVRTPKGSTNVRKADILLPKQLSFDPTDAGAICPRRDALEDQCSPGSQVGKAFARSPMLSEPLKGSVYLVQPQGNGSPDLWLSVDGMGVHTDLRSETATKNGRMRTTFVDLPDFPMSVIRMQFAGGKGSVLSLGHSPCVGAQGSRWMVRVATEGQNGMSRLMHQRLITKSGCRGEALRRQGKRPAETR